MVHCVVRHAVHCVVHCVRVPGVVQPCMLDGGRRALAAALAAVGGAGVRDGRPRRHTVAHQLLERGGALLAWGE